MSEVYLSGEGYQKLRDELKELRDKGRQVVQLLLLSARDCWGGLKVKK